MNILVILVSLFISIILHNIVLPYIAIGGVTPNISLAVLISISFLAVKKYGNRSYGRYLGLIIGLLEDIIFGSVIGVNALIYFLIGILLEKIDKRIVRDSLSSAIVAVVAFTLLYNFMYYVIMYFLSSNISLREFIKKALWIELIYNAVLIVPVYKIYTRLFTTPQISFTRD